MVMLPGIVAMQSNQEENEDAYIEDVHLMPALLPARAVLF